MLRAFMEVRLPGLIDGPDADRYADEPARVRADTLGADAEWKEDASVEDAVEEGATDGMSRWGTAHMLERLDDQG